MTSILRCRDLEDALTSVAAIYRVAPGVLERALPAALSRARDDAEDPIAALPPALDAELQMTPSRPVTIHYFHGTRAFQPQVFAREGLRPLGEMLDLLWRNVGALVPELSEQQLRFLRAELTAGAIAPHTYKARIADSEQHGPCGHLLREVFLDPRAYNSVDYLAGAEIVIDICNAIKDRFEIEATERYRRATTPCIVEFSVPTTDFRFALRAALWYLGAGLQGERTTSANWGYGGDGLALGPETIVSVLSVDDSARPAA